MITSYSAELPTPSEVEAHLESIQASGKAQTKLFIWDDSAGNDIRIISDGETQIILMFDSESWTNFHPSNHSKQTALREAPDEVLDLIDSIEEDLVWSWDDTGKVWYTAAFWSTDRKSWETSYDWEEEHDEESVSWMLETAREIIN